MKTSTVTHKTFTLELSEEELQLIVHSMGSTTGHDLKISFNDHFQEYPENAAGTHQNLYEQLFNLIY